MSIRSVAIGLKKPTANVFFLDLENRLKYIF